MTKAVLEAENEGAAKRAIWRLWSLLQSERFLQAWHASLMARARPALPAKEAAQVGSRDWA